MDFIYGHGWKVEQSFSKISKMCKKEVKKSRNVAKHAKLARMASTFFASLFSVIGLFINVSAVGKNVRNYCAGFSSIIVILVYC